MNIWTMRRKQLLAHIITATLKLHITILTQLLHMYILKQALGNIALVQTQLLEALHVNILVNCVQTVMLCGFAH